VGEAVWVAGSVRDAGEALDLQLHQGAGR
jgi:hypothetical protein